MVVAVAGLASVGLTALVAATGTPPETPSLLPEGAATSLPLNLDVRDSTQVITIVAPSLTSRIADLQAWERRETGWVRVGPRTSAHVALGGLTPSPAEDRPATPLGSFGLTQAFGKLPNPGTRMPYVQVGPGDWWISQPGPLYNTHQVCELECPFALGSPNTHLVDSIRAYNVALVIDYNRFPVVAGAGSAYFLHVTTAGNPTRGCVAIPQAALQALLRWLTPAAHPRILIGLS